jgi:hypothetical protein
MAEPLTVVHRARPLEPTLVEAVPPLLVDAIVQAFNRAERPVILCGPADVRSAMFVDSLATLSERAAAPVLAETTSQFRCWSQTRAIGAFDTIWRTEAGRASFRPDFVLQLGAAPISKGWELLSTDASIARFVVHPWEWADPSSDAEAIVQEYDDHVIVRTSLIYSLDEMDRATAGLVEALRRGQPYTLFTDQRRNPVWAETLSRACVELAGSDYRGVLNVAGRQVLTRAEIGMRMLDWWGVKEREMLSLGPSDGDKWPRDCELDLQRATSVLSTPLLGMDEVFERVREK